MWRTVMIVQLCGVDTNMRYGSRCRGCLRANTTDTTQIMDLEEKGYLTLVTCYQNNTKRDAANERQGQFQFSEFCEHNAIILNAVSIV